MADNITSLAFVAVGIASIYVASGYPPEARLIPIVVASGIVIVATLQLSASLFTALGPLAGKESTSVFADAPADQSEWIRAVIAILSVVVLFALVSLAGIVLGLTAYVPLALWFHARQRLLVLLLAFVISFSLVYGLFVGLMELPLLGGALNW